MKKQLMIVGIIVILLTVGLSGCNEEIKEPSNPMIIHDFQVTPTSIERGGTANLTWDVTGATTVSIDNDIGFVGLIGTQIIQPTKNTTYTLTAKNITDKITATTEIIVEGTIPTTHVPDIDFIHDDVAKTLMVNKISESELNWDNIQITGIAIKPTGTIEVGDVITGCSGTVIVSWKGTSSLGTWTFTKDPTKDVPDIEFFMDEEDTQLIVTSVSESGLSWDNIQITGIATKSTGTIEVGDVITGCYGIVIVSWEGTSSLGTWFFAVENATMPNISFTKTSNKIIVWNVDNALDWNDFEVIYDDLTLVLFNAETGTTLASGEEVADRGTTIMVGDYIYVEDAGTLRLRHKPTNLVIGIWKFT